MARVDVLTDMPRSYGPQVPKDAQDRWVEIAKLVPGRTKGEVMIRVKTLMAEITAKKAMAPTEVSAVRRR